MPSFLFYFFSGAAILSALWVILLPKPTRALLSLVLTMFSLAVLFILLGATFLAMAHLIVYAGAVLVLFLFVIMLEGVGAKDIPLAARFHKGHLILAAILSAAFLATIITVVRADYPRAAGMSGDIKLLGQALFQSYLIPFELTSLLLLLGVFAAVSLAKKDDAE